MTDRFANNTKRLKLATGSFAKQPVCWRSSLARTASLLVLLFSLVSVAPQVSAQSGLAGLLGGDGGNEVLSPDVAFQLELTESGPNNATATFIIEPGHYLYRDKIAFNLADSDDVEIRVNTLTAGKSKEDEFFGTVDVNRDAAVAELEFVHTGGAREIELDITYQGCADIGICYPPQNQRLSFTLSDVSSEPVATSNAGSGATSTGAANQDSTASGAAGAAGASALGLSEQDRLAQRLGNSSLPVIFLLFLGLGVLLAFTPCVLPMVPILSGLIVGQGKEVTVARATLLSAIYVLTMALTYAVAGVLVGISGAGIGFLQNPWVLTAFAALLALLSLSMFGLYELELPQRLQQKLNNLSSNQNGGTFLGVALMGFLSALIVGPCVSAPLVGALIFIADTGNGLIGGVALFALGLGMGLPLLAVGASCGGLLPKAGMWMERVKSVFGVMLLALAIWMLSRFLPAQIILALSAALAIVSGIYLGALDPLQQESKGWHKLAKGSGIIAMVYGVALLVGALSGSQTLLQPLKRTGGAFATLGNSADSTQNVPGAGHELAFHEVKGVDQLDEFLQQAKTDGQPLILDFYADWCVSCKEMEAFTFTDSKVMDQMQKAVLLRADVTKNDKLDKGLLRRFSLFGPPAILFFDPQGDESRNGRVVGYMNKTDFHAHLLNVYTDMAMRALPAQASNTQ